MAVPDHVRSWIGNNWGTRERYLERGFGLATVHEGAVVCWSLADCRSGDACEIGIRTHHAFRRRGLATVTVAAAVEHALKGGFRTVGWHANEDNVASIATAEKVGFSLDRRYVSLYFYSTEAEELAEKGWVAFRAGRFEETVAWYQRVFELRPDSPDFQYHLAARASAATGDTDMAVRHLNRAIDLGWSAADATVACPEFKSIHGDAGVAGGAGADRQWESGRVKTEQPAALRHPLRLFVLALLGFAVSLAVMAGTPSAARVGGEPHMAAAGLPYAIADTGQTRCYDDRGEIACPAAGAPFHGQDAQHAGIGPDYVDNGDGTVTDLSTGLMWQQAPGDKVTFVQAVAGAAALRLAATTTGGCPPSRSSTR